MTRVRWVVVALVMAALTVWVLNRPSEEARVRRVIEGMARDASFKGREGNLSKIAKIESIAAAFTENAELHVDQVVPLESSVQGREAIRGMLMAGAPFVGAVDVKVHDVQVTLGAEGEAKAVLTASVRTGGGKGEFNAQEFEFRMVRMEGRWRVRRIEAVLGFRRPKIR